MSDIVIADKRVLGTQVRRIDVTCPWDLDTIRPGHAAVIESTADSGRRVYPIMAVDRRKGRLALITDGTDPYGGRDMLVSLRVGHRITMLGGPVGAPFSFAVRAVRLLADEWGCAALFWWLRRNREAGVSLEIHHRNIPPHSALGGMLTGLTRQLHHWSGSDLGRLVEPEDGTAVVIALHPTAWSSSEMRDHPLVGRKGVWCWLMEPCLCLDGRCLGCRLKTHDGWRIPCVQGFMIEGSQIDWTWWSSRRVHGRDAARNQETPRHRSTVHPLQRLWRFIARNNRRKDDRRCSAPFKTRAVEDRLCDEKDALVPHRTKDIHTAIDDFSPPLAKQAKDRCPLGIDWPRIRDALLQRRIDQAAGILDRHQPWPHICGRLCPAPCEKGAPDATPSVRWLEAVLAARIRRLRIRGGEAAGGAKKGRVAVIGAGAAGCAAVWRLRGLGLSVTVFDVYPSAGGDVRLAPEFQCPSKMKRRDWERSCPDLEQIRLDDPGVLEALLSERGYDAVLVATGTFTWPVAWAEHPHALWLDEFWHKWRFSPRWSKSWPVCVRRAVVTGRSLAAVNAARLLRRHAIEVVFLVDGLLEDLPVHSFDIHLAREEGVVFVPLRRAVSLDCDGKGLLQGVQAVIQDFAFDQTGRRLVDVAGETETFPADAVIVEAGRPRSWAAMFLHSLAADETGRLFVDSATGMTSRPGVFAAGPVVAGGPETLPESLGHGIRVAESVAGWIERQKGMKACVPSTTTASSTPGVP